jgi:DNA-binding response OmpR family regulator
MDVVRLAWPTEAARRTVLRTRGVPRLLIVDDEAEPPGDLDVLEDWVRAGTNSIDVEARAATLSLRSDRMPPPPFFDDDGLLRYGRQLVLLSPLETRVAQVLVERLGRVVPTATVTAAGWPAGAPAANTVTVTMRRLRDRLKPAGLVLRVVMSRGWMLDLAGRANST